MKNTTNKENKIERLWNSLFLSSKLKSEVPNFNLISLYFIIFLSQNLTNLCFLSYT